MSSKSPRLTAREVVRQLKNHGFTEISRTGSHLKLFNNQTQRTAIVPIHKGKISNFSITAGALPDWVSGTKILPVDEWCIKFKKAVSVTQKGF